VEVDGFFWRGRIYSKRVDEAVHLSSYERISFEGLGVIHTAS
jgi:hypothetical protein